MRALAVLVYLPLLIWSLINQSERVADHSSLLIRSSINNSHSEANYSTSLIRPGRYEDAIQWKRIRRNSGDKLSIKDLEKKLEDAKTDLKKKEENATAQEKLYNDAKAELERLNNTAIEKEKIAKANEAKWGELADKVADAEADSKLTDAEMAKILTELVGSLPKYKGTTADSQDLAGELASIAEDIKQLEQEKTDLEAAIPGMSSDERATSSALEAQRTVLSHKGNNIPANEQQKFDKLEEEHRLAKDKVDNARIRVKSGIPRTLALLQTVVEAKKAKSVLREKQLDLVKVSGPRNDALAAKNLALKEKMLMDEAETAMNEAKTARDECKKEVEKEENVLAEAPKHNEHHWDATKAGANWTHIGAGVGGVVILILLVAVGALGFCQYKNWKRKKTEAKDAEGKIVTSLGTFDKNTPTDPSHLGVTSSAPQHRDARLMISKLERIAPEYPDVPVDAKQPPSSDDKVSPKEPKRKPLKGKKKGKKKRSKNSRSRRESDGDDNEEVGTETASRMNEKFVNEGDYEGGESTGGRNEQTGGRNEQTGGNRKEDPPSVIKNIETTETTQGTTAAGKKEEGVPLAGVGADAPTQGTTTGGTGPKAVTAKDATAKDPPKIPPSS